MLNQSRDFIGRNGVKKPRGRRTFERVRKIQKPIRRVEIEKEKNREIEKGDVKRDKGVERRGLEVEEADSKAIEVEIIFGKANIIFVKNKLRRENEKLTILP